GFVRLKGLYVPTIDAAGHLTQLDLWVGKKEDIEMRGWIESDARFNLAATPIEKLASLNANQLVRVVGRVQSQQLGKTLTIRDETGQVVLKTAQTRPVEIGERIEAVGYPSASSLESNLSKSFYRRTREQ